MIDRLVIVGSGALATFYALKWSENFDVSVIGSWEESINAINSIARKKKIHKLTASSDWKKVKEPDLVIWLTKTYKNLDALNNYFQLNWKSPILILQNGIGQETLFYNILGLKQKIFRGVTTQGVKLIGPGNVLNTGDGEVFVEENELFTGFPVVQKRDIQRMLYLKLAINAVLNPISALYGVTNKNALKGEAGENLRKLVQICYPYFKARQIFASEEEYLHQVRLVAKKTGNNTNSMLVDKQLKRKTEVLEILGPINKELNSSELSKIIHLLNC